MSDIIPISAAAPRIENEQVALIVNERNYNVDLQPGHNFQAFQTAVEQLKTFVPQLCSALNLGEPVATVDGWKPLLDRFDSQVRIGDKPVVVATLFGPTGAGKSAIFRMLTGIPVPSGNRVRPMTYGCVAAVPLGIHEIDQVRKVFPSHEVEELTDLEHLGRKESNVRDILFYTKYEGGADGDLPLILVDVPDINSIETSNWGRAWRVLERAELVVFVTTSGQYGDNRSVKALEECCGLAAHLAIVLTQILPGQLPQIIWDDLIANKTAGEGFSQYRSGGRTTRRKFLESASVYWSPIQINDPPRLEEIRPLRDGTPQLTSLLRGIEAEQLVLKGLQEPASKVAKAVRRLLSESETQKTQMTDNLKKAEEILPSTAAKIAGGQYPIGKVLELILRECASSRTRVERILMTPVMWVSVGFVKIAKGVVKTLSGWLQTVEETGGVRDQMALEREKRHCGAEELVDRWRSLFPGEAGNGILKAINTRKVVDQLNEQPLPEVMTGWETSVIEETRKWVSEHPWYARVLPAVASTLGIAGLTAIAVDLCTGGLGTIGVITAAAGGNMAAAILLEQFRRLKLTRVVKSADVAWCKQRTEELTRHLHEHLFTPLFHPWQEILVGLDRMPRDECRKACEAIEQLIASPPAGRETAHE